MRLWPRRVVRTVHVGHRGKPAVRLEHRASVRAARVGQDRLSLSRRVRGNGVDDLADAGVEPRCTRGDEADVMAVERRAEDGPARVVDVPRGVPREPLGGGKGAGRRTSKASVAWRLSPVTSARPTTVSQDVSCHATGKRTVRVDSACSRMKANVKMEMRNERAIRKPYCACPVPHELLTTHSK